MQSYGELKSYINTLAQILKILRDAVHQANPPLVPYLGKKSNFFFSLKYLVWFVKGVYLSDLTFIEDGNADTVHNGLINFDKRRFLANVISEIQQYQQTPY
jgi:hypothetical protein